MGQKNGGAKRGRRSANGGRNDQVVRNIRMVMELGRVGGRDVYSLAEHFGMGVRTIRRDLIALEAAGIRLVKEQAEDSSRVLYALDPGAAHDLANLVEASHFLALRLAMAEGTVARRNESLFASLEQLSDAIEKALGRSGREQLREIDRCFFSWDKFAWRTAPKDIVWPLVQAISGKQLCEVRYRAPSSGNKEKTFRVLPLRLFVHNGSLYLHAWSPKSEQVLLLNLQRLISLKVLDETLETPATYDPAQLEASAFGIFIGPEPVEFVLRFDAFARPYIEERTWHPTEERTTNGDGSLTLTFRCAPSYEVTNWVASWKEHVEILAPKTLRAEFADYGRWLAKQYAQ